MHSPILTVSLAILATGSTATAQIGKLEILDAPKGQDYVAFYEGEPVVRVAKLHEEKIPGTGKELNTRFQLEPRDFAGTITTSGRFEAVELGWYYRGTVSELLLFDAADENGNPISTEGHELDELAGYRKSSPFSEWISLDGTERVPLPGIVGDISDFLVYPDRISITTQPGAKRYVFPRGTPSSAVPANLVTGTISTNFVAAWDSSTGIRYAVETSQDMENWTEIIVLDGTGEKMRWSNPITGDQFYRIVIAKAP